MPDFQDHHGFGMANVPDEIGMDDDQLSPTVGDWAAPQGNESGLTGGVL